MVNSDAPLSRRERSRQAKTRRYLDTALKILDTDGFDALTMQRISDECDTASGAIYRYFPTKGALVADVQAEAIRRLTASYLILRESSERSLVRSNLTEGGRALARMLLFAHFIIAASEEYPQEFHLLQILMTDWPTQVPIDEGHRVLPVAMELLSLAIERMQDCIDLGALSEGNAAERTVTWAAALSGVLLLSTLQDYGAELFQGSRLAESMSRDLLVGWSAEPDLVDSVEAFLKRYAKRESLAPPPAIA